jgi:phage terminase large subunit-like protein
MIDASLSGTTNCRIDVSTPNGTANPFAAKRFSMPPHQIFTLHWRQDPRKNEAWYEAQKQKHRHEPWILAQEVDLDYEASVSGLAFKKEWARYYSITEHHYIVLGDKRYHLDALHERFLTVDPATTVKKAVKADPDYTAISAWLITPCGLLVWLACLRMRMEGPDIPGRVAEMYLRHRANRVHVEGGGTQKVVYQYLQRHNLSGRPGNKMNVIEFIPRKDKREEAGDAIAAMEAGRVWLPAADPMFPLGEVLWEIVRFTGDGKVHDDTISSFSQAARQLTRRDKEKPARRGFRFQCLGPRIGRIIW